MNLVGLLVVPIVVRSAGSLAMILTGLVLVVIIAIALVVSKRKGEAQIEVQRRVGDDEAA